MGNRAIIKPINENIGVYLHWNGGINSVTAFLEYCKLKDYRYLGGERADGYGIARFCQVVGNFFGGGLSLGIMTGVEATEECAAGLDNGIYVIDGWDIVENIGGYYNDNYDIQEMLIDIDKAQPEAEQLGEAYIRAEEVDALDLTIGDKVAVLNYEGRAEIHTVVDLKHERGQMLANPVIDMYPNHEDINPNNILRGKVRRVRDDRN